MVREESRNKWTCISARASCCQMHGDLQVLEETPSVSKSARVLPLMPPFWQVQVSAASSSHPHLRFSPWRVCHTILCCILLCRCCIHQHVNGADWNSFNIIQCKNDIESVTSKCKFKNCLTKRLAVSERWHQIAVLFLNLEALIRLVLEFSRLSRLKPWASVISVCQCGACRVLNKFHWSQGGLL